MDIADSVDHVIITTVDALRPANLGCYGYEHDISPNIDQLAADGVCFDSAYTTANSTYPSVTSIHSGAHPSNVVINHGGRVTQPEKQRAESLQTIPKSLADREDYFSAWAGGVFGLWHKNGFDYFPPLRPSHDKRVLFEDDGTRSELRGMLEKLNGTFADVVSDTYYRFEQSVGRVKERIREMEDENEGDDIDTILSKFDAARERDQGFYGYLHLNNTHTPYEADDELIERYLEEHDYPNEPIERITNPQPPNCSAVATAPYTDDWFDERDFEVGVARWLARYDACVREADRKVGRLVKELESRGALDNTLLVVLADHGESLNENGIYFAHDGLYEPVTRIPFVVRAPTGESGTVSEFVQPIDIAPTVAKAFDLSPQSFQFHGESLAPFLGYEGEAPDREAICFEMASCQRRRAVRKGDYKYIYPPTGDLGNIHDDFVTCRKCGHVHWEEEEELYDLSKDPGEQTNLADDRPELAEEMRETGEALGKQYQLKDVDESVEISYEEEEQIAERLEHLGYQR